MEYCRDWSADRRRFSVEDKLDRRRWLELHTHTRARAHTHITRYPMRYELQKTCQAHRSKCKAWNISNTKWRTGLPGVLDRWRWQLLLWSMKCFVIPKTWSIFAFSTISLTHSFTHSLTHSTERLTSKTNKHSEWVSWWNSFMLIFQFYSGSESYYLYIGKTFCAPLR